MDFWDYFWLMLIYIPMLFIWGFAMVDIFRRDDISGIAKALWVIAIFVLPFFGTLIYLLFRPTGATFSERTYLTPHPYGPDHTAQLEILANLHDRGKLSDAEFAAEKARVLGSAGDAPVATTA